MLQLVLFAVLFVLILSSCASLLRERVPVTPGPRSSSPSVGSERRDRPIVLATTTSVQDSGLLEVLLPVFERESGYTVKVIAVGTGQALELGRRGEADVLLVHAPRAEEQFMAEGNGKIRWLVATNDFVIVGPPDDPAHVAGFRDAVACLRNIAAVGATWVSRDDRSGTDLLEKALWQEAGIDPRDRPWFVSSGQGMGMTLVLTDQKRGYALSDRSTYLAYREKLDLRIVCEGDPRLLNQYHVITVDPQRFPAVNAAGAELLARFLVSLEAQAIIGTFGTERYGQPIFRPALTPAATPVR